MNDVYNSIGETAAFGIICHEIGHHIDRMQIGDYVWVNGHPWDTELRADALCGCALARAHLTQAQTRVALQAIARYPSNTHPGWEIRWQALNTGYEQCGGYNLPQIQVTTRLWQVE